MISQKEKQYVKSQILKISNGQVDLLELSKFINYLKNLIHNHLYLKKLDFLKFISKYGLDSVDVSIEVLSEVFKKNQLGEFVTFKNFINNIKNINEIKEDDLFISFMTLVRRITDVTISKIYAEYDQSGYKLLRNIRNHLPTEELELIKFCGENFIRLKNYNSDHLPYLEFEDFRCLFLSKRFNNAQIPELLKHLAETLILLTNYRKEIKLIDTVILFREVLHIMNFDDANIDDENEYFVYDSASSSIDLILLKEKCLQIVQIKLFEYSQKNRFTYEQIRAIYFAFGDVIQDLLYNGGSQKSLYNYLKNYLPLTENDYITNFRTKIEYLNKIIRKKLMNYLKD